MEKKDFTITAYTEDQVGLLQRVTIIFTKRKINIESITASESEMEGVYRFTIAVHTTEELVRKIVSQIEKQIDVFKASFYGEEDVVQQEVALYKIPTKALSLQGKAEKIVRNHHARLLAVEDEYTVIEKTGFRSETEDLFRELTPFGIKEFVRSGRIAVSRNEHGIGSSVKEILN